MVTTHQEKILIVFDDMIADDIMTSKKIKAIIKELFIRCKKFNISLVFITQSYFFCCKRSQLIRLFRFYALLNNEDSQQDRVTKYWHWSFTDFMKIYRKCTSEPYSFLTIDTTLHVDNPLRFRKNLLIPYKNDINWWT